MDSASALQFAQDAVAAAIRYGAASCDASVSIADRFSAEARDSTITKLEQSTGRSMSVRVFGREGRKASMTTSDLQRESVESALKRLVDAAQYVAADVFAGLPDDARPQDDDLQLFSAEVAQRDARSKLDEVLALERFVRKADPRIVNSNGSHFGDSVGVIALANSNGFAASYRSTRANRSASPVAQDGQAKRTGYYGTAGRRLNSLEDVQSVAAKAASRAVDLFGARKPATMRAPVIFERDVAATVLGDIATAVSGANIAVGNSWLAGRIGERIGSDLASIVDDGRIPGALGTAPFDGEGVPTRRTPVFQNGALRSYLLDTYYGRKLGMASTGNSSGGGISANTLFLEPGDESLDELIARTERGFLVVETIGFATEYATGTYSRGARGFFIEDGERAYPVEEFTIASTYPAMLAGLDAVANDLILDSTIVSPSFRVNEMTISGN